MNKIEPYKGIAAIYDEMRPSYPEKLIEDIINKTNLKLRDRVLEIGPGTGKATVQFGEKGFNIHAVELGKDMAEILADKCAKYSKVSIEVCPFEQWNSNMHNKFSMIYCAQAFHWLDRNIKYKKCYDLLEDEGYLVLFWYNAGEDESEATKAINEKVQKVIGKYTQNVAQSKESAERLTHSGVSQDEERRAEIDDSGFFKVIEKLYYKEERMNNAEQYLKVNKTVPAHASILDGLNEEAIEKMDNEIIEIINQQGGYVGTTFDFSLYIAKKI